MFKRAMLGVLVMAVLGGWLAGGGRVASAQLMTGASTCTSITSLPYTISSPGTYCLGSNLAAAAAPVSNDYAAITIEADDVVLDLAGRLLDGSAQKGPSWDNVKPPIGVRVGWSGGAQTGRG